MSEKRWLRGKWIRDCIECGKQGCGAMWNHGCILPTEQDVVEVEGIITKRDGRILLLDGDAIHDVTGKLELRECQKVRVTVEGGEIDGRKSLLRRVQKLLQLYRYVHTL